MYAARRLWAVAAVAGVGAALALLTRAPQVVLATAGVCAYVLVAQALAVRAFGRVDRALTVAQTVTPRVAVRDGVVEWRVEATLETPRSVPVTCTAALPPSVRPAAPSDDGDVQITIPPGETSAAATRELRADTAGRVAFDAPTVRVAGPSGLFGTRLAVPGATATLTVEPDEPRDVRIGRGSDQPRSSFGTHGGGDLGTGLDPAGAREYVPGDPRRYIDWNTTARRNEPYVREYDPGADAEFALVFDHGGTDVGPPGGTMLAFLRDVALDAVAAAAADAAPVGLYTVDAGGVARHHRSTAAADGYRRIAEVLRAVEAGDERARAGVDTPDVAVGRRTSQRRYDRLGETAAGDPFAARLRPLVEPRTTVVGRADETPLLGVVRSLRTEATAETHVVLFTSDRDRAETYDAVALAARVADQVTVFVTPTVLFEPDALADLTDARARYRSFEAFRGQLDELESVRAFEVAPGDRLETLLQTREVRR